MSGPRGGSRAVKLLDAVGQLVDSENPLATEEASNSNMSSLLAAILVELKIANVHLSEISDLIVREEDLT